MTLRTCTVVFCAAIAAAPLTGQRRSANLRPLRTSEGVVEAFADVVGPANASTVVVRVDGKRVALGTVVRAALVVTKASELDTGTLTCVVAGEECAARTLATDRDSDLALLRVEADGLVAADWSVSTLQRGAWLATPDGDGAPLGIGILSSAPYRHSRDRGYLGVQMHTDRSPVRLRVVHEGTAAAAAGLEADDTILAIDAEPVRTSQQFVQAIGSRKPGDEIRLKIKRGDEELTISATLRRDRSGRRSDQERIWGPLSDVRAGFDVVLQHDTVLRPDQCGGPIVGLDGKVVGVNVARAGRVETLALPAEAVLGVVERLSKQAEDASGDRGVGERSKRERRPPPAGPG